MASLRRELPARYKKHADRLPRTQSYNVNSPNEMVVDSGDYVGVANEPDKEPVTIINPDSPEGETDQLQDLPMANDRAYSLVPDSPPRGYPQPPQEAPRCPSLTGSFR